MKKGKSISLGIVGLVVLFIVTQAFVVKNNIKSNYHEVSEKWETVKKEVSKEEPNIANKNEAIDSYNAVLKRYNISVKKFPNKVYANLFGYKAIDYYVYKSKNIDINVEF